MSKLCRIKKILTLLTCSVITVSLISAYSGNESDNNKIHAKTIAEIQEERKQNEDKIADLQNDIDALEGKKDEEQKYQETLSDQIQLLQNNILLLDTEINQLSVDISAAEENIAELSKDITNQEAEVNANIELFKERLCAMYVTGNNSLASAVLGSSDFYDMLSRVEMVNNIAAHDEELVDNLLVEIDNLQKSKSTLETEKLNLEMNKETQETKRKEKADEINELKDAMQKSQDEIDRLALEQQKKKKSKEEREADNALLDAQEKEIIAAEEAAKKKREEQARKEREEQERQQLLQQQQQQQNNNNSNNSGNETYTPPVEQPIETPAASGFSWPAPGFYYITSGYGQRWGTMHRGIDISGGGIAGASACASKSGTVIAVNNSCTHDSPKYSNCCGNGYGNYVLIDHGDGTTTLYGHLSYASVSVGETVSQQQAIGAIGCTGFSTGTHLHFEIRINGSAVDPSSYV